HLSNLTLDLNLSLSRPPRTSIFFSLSLPDALPILPVRARHDPLLPEGRADPGQCAHLALRAARRAVARAGPHARTGGQGSARRRDRKSTRLNSSHVKTSYAVVCLKKQIKKKKENMT